MYEQRSVVAAANIVLSRPYQLDGPAGPDGFCDLRQFGGEVHALLGAAAETAASEHRLKLDLVKWHAEHACYGGMVAALELAAISCRRALAIPAQETVERLHRGMGEIREYEF